MPVKTIKLDCNMPLRKWGKLFFVFICFFVLFFSITLKNQVWAANEPRIVRVGIYDNKPKVYLDDKKVAAGVFPDILNYIAKQENWQLEYVSGTWEEGLARLEKGEINIMVDVALSAERRQKYDFTNETILSSWGVVYVRKNSDIDSFKDLDGKTIAILKSSVYSGGPEGVDQYVRTFGLKTDFIYVDEYNEVFNLLSRGKVDAAVVSRVFALSSQKDYPDLKETDMFFSPTELRFALTKGDVDNPVLINQIDYWVKKIRNENNGIYHQTLEKHGLAGMITSKEVIPQWAKIAGTASGVLILLSLLIIVAMRQARILTIRKLEEKEILLSSIVNHAPIMVFAFDRQGKITLAEGKALQNPILKQKLLVGKSVFELLETNQIAADQLKKTLLGEEVELKSELAGRMWRINMSPVVVAKNVRSVLGIAIDLTEEYQLDYAKSEFLSLVSHHLRTLPSVIRWTVEILTPKMKTVLDKKELKNWERIEEANLKMIELADAISRASQMELEKYDARPEKLDLEKLIDEEVAALDALIKKNKLKIVKKYHTLKGVVLDKNQVKIIIRTLLSNAVRYISPGGTVEVSLSANNNKFVLKVKDTGWGIPQDQQDKVFTKLFRADNVVKMEVIGIGLGLFIAKNIIDKLKGRIWFESQEGQGSIFNVELPVRT